MIKNKVKRYKFKNIFFNADNMGLFIFKKELISNYNILTQDNWSHAKLILDDFKTKFFINDILIGAADYKNSGDMAFGFRGSSKNVYIDNVIVKDKKLKIIFKDDFNLKNKFIKYISLLFLILIIIDVLILLLNIFFKINLKNLLFWIIIISMNFMTAASFCNIYLRWKAARYPSKESLFKQNINPFIEEINYKDNISDSNISSEESVENEEKNTAVTDNVIQKSDSLNEINFGEIKNDFIRDLYDSAKLSIENNRKQYSIVPDPDICRIVFVGTSQTWGSGAKDYGETFVNRIQDNLNKKSVQNIKFECINASIQGMVSYQLFNIYRDYYLPYSPDITIINLSNNDASDLGSPQVFNESLENFIKLNNENKIKTLFIIEPNSIENLTDNILKYHSIMKEAGKKYNIPAIDLYGFMTVNYDAGFLWWDSVHMSSAGHYLTAEFLTDKIKDSIDENLIKAVKGKKLDKYFTN